MTKKALEVKNLFKAAANITVDSALLYCISFKIVTALNKEPRRKQEAAQWRTGVFVQTFRFVMKFPCQHAQVT